MKAVISVHDDPVARGASPVEQMLATLETSTGRVIAAHVYHGDDPLTVDPAAIHAEHGAVSALLIGVTGNRVRVGPLLFPPIASDAGGERIGDEPAACLDCLSLWISHNRPDAARWRRVAELKGSIASTNLAWTPATIHALAAAAEQIVAADDHSTFFDVEIGSLSATRHRYLRYPGCPRCDRPSEDGPGFARRPDGPACKIAPDVFRTHALPTLARLRDAYVDHRVGLVQHMYRDFTSKMLPMWGAESRLTKSDLVEIGFGRAESGRTAEAVAILESLERFCGFEPRKRRISVRGSYGALAERGMPVVDPEAFLLCEDAQHDEPGYNLVAYTPELEYDWIWAYSFAADGPVLVPLQFSFFDGRLVPPTEKFVLETSNGCALGGAYEEAIFHGLLEVIERDAYMTRWHAKGTPRRIALDDPAMPQVRRLHARALAEGYELHAFAIDIEIAVPVVLAMIVDPRSDAGVASYCASGASPDPESAVMGALVEVCSSIGVYQRQFGTERARASELLADPAEVRQMRDHVLLYSHPAAVERLSFLDREMPTTRVAEIYRDITDRWKGTDLTAQMRDLVTEVRKIARDVIVVDQGSSVLDPFGLHCVKVLAPGMHPVTFGHQFRRLDEARLESARATLYTREGYAEAGRNSHPHNFP